MSNSSESTPNANNRRYLEVALDDPSDIQIQALSAFLGTMQGQVREISPDYEPADDQGEVVTEQDFLEMSSDLFGTDRYGKTAHSIVADRVHDMHTEIVERRGLIQFGYLKGLGTDDDYIAPGGTGLSQVMRAAQNRIARIPFPATASFAVPGEDLRGGQGEQILFVLQPRDVTKEGLARFAKSRDYPGHRLHGLLGKSLDVLNAVADVAEPRSTEPYNEEDFVSLERIVELAKSEGLTLQTVRIIKERIYRFLLGQAQSGIPELSNNRELVVEGNFDASKWYSTKPAEQVIAISSLANLGASMRKRSGNFFVGLPELLQAQPTDE